MCPALQTKATGKLQPLYCVLSTNILLERARLMTRLICSEAGGGGSSISEWSRCSTCILFPHYSRFSTDSLLVKYDASHFISSSAFSRGRRCKKYDMKTCMSTVCLMQYNQECIKPCFYIIKYCGSGHKGCRYSRRQNTVMT